MLAEPSLPYARWLAFEAASRLSRTCASGPRSVGINQHAFITAVEVRNQYSPFFGTPDLPSVLVKEGCLQLTLPIRVKGGCLTCHLKEELCALI